MNKDKKTKVSPLELFSSLWMKTSHHFFFFFLKFFLNLKKKKNLTIWTLKVPMDDGDGSAVVEVLHPPRYLLPPVSEHRGGDGLALRQHSGGGVLAISTQIRYFFFFKIYFYLFSP